MVEIVHGGGFADHETAFYSRSFHRIERRNCVHCGNSTGAVAARYHSHDLRRRAGACRETRGDCSWHRPLTLRSICQLARLLPVWPNHRACLCAHVRRPPMLPRLHLPRGDVRQGLIGRQLQSNGLARVPLWAQSLSVWPRRPSPRIRYAPIATENGAPPHAM